MRYLDINKTLVPFSMLIVIEDDQWEFIFHYNATKDFFTVTLLKDDVELITGEKVVLDKPLFTLAGYPFNSTYFIPLDLSQTENRVSYENLNDTVLIYEFHIEDGVVIDDDELE